MSTLYIAIVHYISKLHLNIVHWIRENKTVIRSDFFLIPGQVGAAGEDSWTVSGQKDDVRGAQLDLHGDHRHDSLEHPSPRHFPEAVQTRSPGGFSVQARKIRRREKPFLA